MTRPKRILIVDDEKGVRQVLMHMVASFGHEAELASDGFEALAKLKLSVDLVLLDLVMPGLDGFEVAQRIREDPDCGDLPILVLTALQGDEDVRRALEAGANDFISKPFDRTELQERIATLLNLKEIRDNSVPHGRPQNGDMGRQLTVLRGALEQSAEARRETHEAYLDTIHRLAVASEYRDDDTAAHIRRMGAYSAVLGRALSLTPAEVERIQHASPMHDVGKIGIPDRILLKPGRLDPDEMDIMRQHAVIGSRILSGSSSALLHEGEVIALSHHEKWDGTGYPKGLSGEDIPLAGRICAVSDVFDALTTDRPYKEAFPNDKAYRILREEQGRHLDPEAVHTFFEQIGEIEEIQERYRQPEEPASGRELAEQSCKDSP